MLEGELPRSVQSIGAVAVARVHLAIPKPSVSVKEQQKPSASVVLSLQSGRMLNSAQVGAIVHLISSNVPELSAKNLTVAGQLRKIAARAVPTACRKEKSEIVAESNDPQIAEAEKMATGTAKVGTLRNQINGVHPISKASR